MTQGTYYPEIKGNLSIKFKEKPKRKTNLLQKLKLLITSESLILIRK